MTSKRIGERFERLTIIEEITKGRYICKCDCGNTKEVLYSSLRHGRVKSCGCLKKEGLHLKNLNFKDITGEKYNRLTAIKFIKIYDKTKDSIYEWRCDCGNIIEVPKGRVKFGTTKSCGCLKKEHFGENHWRWRHDLTNDDRLNSKFRTHSPEYKEWRKKVFERDSYTCDISKQIGGDLQAHHLIDWANAIDSRFNIENGITLCKEIHDEFHRVYGKGNNTKEQYEEFKRNYK